MARPKKYIIKLSNEERACRSACYPDGLQPSPRGTEVDRTLPKCRNGVSCHDVAVPVPQGCGNGMKKALQFENI